MTLKNNCACLCSAATRRSALRLFWLVRMQQNQETSSLNLNMSLQACFWVSSLSLIGARRHPTLFVREISLKEGRKGHPLAEFSNIALVLLFFLSQQHNNAWKVASSNFRHRKIEVSTDSSDCFPLLINYLDLYEARWTALRVRLVIENYLSLWDFPLACGQESSLSPKWKICSRRLVTSFLTERHFPFFLLRPFQNQVCNFYLLCCVLSGYLSAAVN